MEYQKQPNPHLNADGRVVPGKAGIAMEFAKAEDAKWLASLPDEERTDVLRQRRQLQDHMNVYVASSEPS